MTFWVFHYALFHQSSYWFSSSISFSVLVPIPLWYSFSILVHHVDSHITSASFPPVIFIAMHGSTSQFVTSIALTLALWFSQTLSSIVIIIHTGSLFIHIILVLCLHVGSLCGVTPHIWICTPSHISKEREKVRMYV